MHYISWEYSIAGWIFAAVFFVFLLGFWWGQRVPRPAPKDQSSGFEVVPVEYQSDEKQS
jgi:hypothetical protein